MAELNKVKQALRRAGNPERAKHSMRYFKPGYAKDDKFLGTSVPDQRTVAKQFFAQLDDREVLELLHSPWHEERQTALIMLALRFKKTDETGRLTIVNTYLANTAWVNNWDLVDTSAGSILGAWLFDKDKTLLYQLTKSKNLWERRIAIIATLEFTRRGQPAESFKLAELLLHDKENYLHKAVGWTLREAAKKDQPRLRAFLDKHAATMPRMALRYAIEHFQPAERAHYLGLAAPARVK